MIEDLTLMVDRNNQISVHQCKIWESLDNKERCYLEDISKFFFSTTVRLNPDSELATKLSELGYGHVDAEKYLARRIEVDRFFRNFICLHNNGIWCREVAATFFFTRPGANKVRWTGNSYDINITDEWYALPKIPALRS